MGKPLKYNNADELQIQIDAYFANCLEREAPYTFSGLAYFLGFLERKSLYEYAQRGDELSTPIKKATLRIEQDYEEHLRKTSCTGAIFALKNRGWTDKTEVEHSGHIESEPTVFVIETKEIHTGKCDK